MHACVSIDDDGSDSVISRLTGAPGHHFFGYYGMNPWSSDGALHLALETDFHERLIRRGDVARAGVVSSGSGEFRPLLETRGFNFQQGAMLHWASLNGREVFTCNDVEGTGAVTRLLTPEGELLRTIPRGLAALAPGGRRAAGLDFARMYHCRSVVGYCSELEEGDLAAVPEDDGLFDLDLETGASELVLSIAEVMRFAAGAGAGDAGALTWFNHPVYNPAGDRLVFLCRVRGTGRFASSLWSANPDGSDLCPLIPFGGRISHFAWLDERRIVVSTDVLGEMRFTVFTDRGSDFAPFGGGDLPDDGHMVLSPDREWMITDTYPRGEAREAKLLLCRLADGQVRKLGGFRHEEIFGGDIRCDLHPRLSADGRRISFDSVHEGTRQIYVADVPDG
jgi:hypothetical protein